MLSYSFKQAPNPSSVLGVFGLSIRTTERDLDEEFTRFGHVEKVTIVYDQRVCQPCARKSFFLFFCLTPFQSDRSRGFGFIRMSTVEEATKCIAELNGIVRISVHEYEFYLYFSESIFSGPQWSTHSCGLLSY